MPTIIINTDASDITQASVRAINVLTPVQIPQVVVGDNRAYELIFVTKAGVPTTWSGSEDYSLRVAIGPAGQNATGGTFTISGDGVILSGTTNPTRWDADPASVVSALVDPVNGLLVISTGLKLTAAQVEVTGNASDYVLNFVGTLAGIAIGALSADGTQLTPSASAVVSVVRSGGSGINARQSLRVRQIPYCFQDAWTPTANGWTGNIETNTYALFQFLDNCTSRDLPFEVEVTDPDGNRTTYLQTTTAILNEVIDGQALVPTPLPSYYTKTETDALLDAKQDTITLTTTGSGEATFDGSTLNIPTPPAPQDPIALTTDGEGAATLVGSVLNIPTPTPDNIGAASISQLNFEANDRVTADIILQSVLEDVSALAAISVGEGTGFLELAYRLVKQSGLPDPINNTWTLYASTAATVAGVTQRPNNYDGSTNAFVWYQTA